MVILVVGLVVFLGVHLSAVVGLREPMVARLGEGRWKGLYSVLSAIGLLAIVIGYGQARQAPTMLWAPPSWTRHAVFTLMLPVFPLLSAAYLPGRIRSAVRHPMLLATALWGASHLLANGSSADALLFGGFALWAIVDIVSLSRRGQRPIPGAPPSPWNDAIAVVVGLGMYVATLLVLHGWLIGVPLL
jgi:uncharacterized membrane protein